MKQMNEELIAPCGMNCAVCSGYLAGQHDVKSMGIRIPLTAPAVGQETKSVHS